MQSKTWSLIEACLNVLIGAGIALATQLFVFPFVGIHIDMQTNLIIVAIFTAVSIIRSFYVRRFFNWIYVKGHDVKAVAYIDMVRKFLNDV